jgi:long-chain acyl-CoA synthetase
MPLVEALLTHATQQPDSLAVIDDRGRFTYRQLAAMAAGMARVLDERTRQPRVGLLLPTGAGFVASFYGGLLAGKAVVPLNFLLSDREIDHCVRDSGIDAVVTIPQLAGRVGSLGVNVIDLTQLPQGTGPPPSSQAPAIAPRPPAASADDVAALIYTSGTSGLPKGVPLTYENLQSNVDAAIAHVNFQRSHAFLGILPLFHVFGLNAMMLAPIQLGATIVYQSRFSPAGAVAAIKEHGISLVGGVPSMYAAILRLKEASPDDFKTIYAMISGGEPLPATLVEAFRARYGITLLDAYGMTETSLAVALNTPQAFKLGSVGRPVPGMRVQIIDDAGNDLPAGQTGEIVVKGPMVMKGYHNLPTETAAVMTADGGFKTGDLGRIGADGFIYVTGRKKDLIIVSGEKVSPREVEEALMTHPAVAEAAVIGRKDATRGEVVTAFVIGREGVSLNPETLREHCRQQGLPPWKVPREIQVVQDFPRSPTGKVLKRELAARPQA